MSAASSRSLLFLFFVRSRLHPQVALCPHDNSIEGLVNFCSDTMAISYDITYDGDSFRDEKRIVNTTCEIYRERTSCYKRLLHQCHLDQRVTYDVTMILHRLSIYSRTCHHDNAGGIQLIRCYEAFSRQMRTCSQAFDAYYPFYVNGDQTRSACRVLNSAINCLLQIEQEIEDTCGNPSWSVDFHMAYIKPLVHLSQNSTYRVQCSIPTHLKNIHFPSASLSCSTKTELCLLLKITVSFVLAFR